MGNYWDHNEALQWVLQILKESKLGKNAFYRISNLMETGWKTGKRH